MALPDISLAQFNRIASGDYNAGQIDIKTGKNGPELVKINNHVWQTGKNNVMLSPERILEVKEVFLSALEKAHVPKAKMDEIRARLGLPAEMDVATSKAERVEVLKARYTPLSRALVRELLDQYAKYGKGYTPSTSSPPSRPRLSIALTPNAPVRPPFRFRPPLPTAMNFLRPPVPTVT